MPNVLRHLRRGTFHTTSAVGNERHCVLDCPHFHFQGFWQQHAVLFQDSHDAKRSYMWNQDLLVLLYQPLSLRLRHHDLSS